MKVEYSVYSVYFIMPSPRFVLMSLCLSIKSLLVPFTDNRCYQKVDQILWKNWMSVITFLLEMTWWWCAIRDGRKRAPVFNACARDVFATTFVWWKCTRERAQGPLCSSNPLNSLDCSPKSHLYWIANHSGWNETRMFKNCKHWGYLWVL